MACLRAHAILPVGHGLPVSYLTARRMPGTPAASLLPSRLYRLTILFPVLLLLWDARLGCVRANRARLAMEESSVQLRTTFSSGALADGVPTQRRSTAGARHATLVATPLLPAISFKRFHCLMWLARRGTFSRPLFFTRILLPLSVPASYLPLPAGHSIGFHAFKGGAHNTHAARAHAHLQLPPTSHWDTEPTQTIRI